MQDQVLEDMLTQEIKHETQVFAAFLGGALFAVGGLALLMLRHIMHKAVGVCIIAILVFGFAALSYTIDVLRLRRLRSSGLLARMEEWKRVRFSFRVKGRGRDFDLGHDMLMPATAKKVCLHLQKQDGESLRVRLPAAYAGKLQQAIKLHFPGIYLSQEN